MTPSVRYPAGPATPHGAYQILKGDIPLVRYRSHDDSTVFDLMGGMSAPFHDRTLPECIALRGLKGLIPPWQTIDQKGATEDGVTFLDALYDPIEIDAELTAVGRDPKYTRRVIRDWIAANDVKETGELSWFTHELGRWWADVRWFKTPTDKLMGTQRNRQDFTWTWRADNAFWRSYDDIDMFRFAFESVIDEFAAPTIANLGDDWDTNYTGTGGGYIAADGTAAVWIDDPEDPILTNGRTVDCRRKNFETDTNNQAIECIVGSFPEWSYPDNAYNFLWGRMKTTGTPGAWGIRLIFGIGYLRLSSFVNGVEYIIRDRGLIVPPMPGEKFTLVCGFEGNERLYKVYRNGIEILSAVEPTGANIGPEYRGVGFGMHAGAAILTQATPASILRWNAADNMTVTQSGWLTRRNAGDQEMFDRLTLFGPGTFRIGNGPNTSDYVEFGPLLNNQVVRINTDPRDRQITDLTSIPPTPQELNQFQRALKDFIGFATANNVPPILQAIESMFGIVPPQGNLYSLLRGRWSRGIPKKSPGAPVKAHKVFVSIDDGNADSAVMASGTPLRRYPA